MTGQETTTQTQCFHCGENCDTQSITADDKSFCCEGCKMVYGILNKSGLCSYYDLNTNPGKSQRIAVRPGKFLFLDDEKIANRLTSFKDQNQTRISFYTPQMHCSSCLWLLENLHRINENIVSSKVTFSSKEVDIVFNHNRTSLRQVAETLTSIGYEPYISLQNIEEARPAINRTKIYKLGIAGFCFVNIMLLAFPEYLGIDAREAGLLTYFRILSLLLSLPVFFYSATEFYSSAWKSLKHGFLNIDAPIVLAIMVTFVRSLVEVVNGTGGGYFDSLSGIVFFMLAGRVLQDKTFAQLSFDRDYKAYFPVAVTCVRAEKQTTVPLNDIKLDDTLIIHNQELIPVDGIITKGKAIIDYSFVTGESIPVEKEMGEIVYAGGKQTGGNIELLVIKEVSQSYLTKLWNQGNENSRNEKNENSFVHLVSRYFTWFVLAIAGGAALYWYFIDPTHITNAVTSVLIIACPCALLLSNSFTNGNILRILSRNKFYLRNAETIENIANSTHIVFDKTGTLTNSINQQICYFGRELTSEQKRKIASLAMHSGHPLSRSLASYLNEKKHYSISNFNEVTGEGIRGIATGSEVAIGSYHFIYGLKKKTEVTELYISIDGEKMGCFAFRNTYRNNIQELLHKLKRHYTISILSGDNSGEKTTLEQMLGKGADTRFHQTPTDKLDAIRHLQQAGKKVMMIGDGLNDAGALRAATVGIAVSEAANNFTPASDAIIEADQLPLLDKFIAMCRINKQIVWFSFVISILYNLAGLYFAVQATLSPTIAAILMPASSISIVLITFGLSNLAARRLQLS